MRKGLGRAYDKWDTLVVTCDTDVPKTFEGMTSTRSASDKVYQLLAHGRWFSSSTQASSAITKTGRHDIAEILLKVALKHPKNKSNQTQT